VAFLPLQRRLPLILMRGFDASPRGERAFLMRCSARAGFSAPSTFITNAITIAIIRYRSICGAVCGFLLLLSWLVRKRYWRLLPATTLSPVFSCRLFARRREGPTRRAGGAAFSGDRSLAGRSAHTTTFGTFVAGGGMAGCMALSRYGVLAVQTR